MLILIVFTDRAHAGGTPPKIWNDPPSVPPDIAGKVRQFFIFIRYTFFV